MANVRILQAGEQGLVVEFGNEINPTINRRVRQLGDLLSAADITGVMEIIPTYRSLMVYFNPLVIPRDRMIFQVQALIEKENANNEEVSTDQETREVEIPVCYGGEFGPDLDFVASHNGLTIPEVIEIHSAGNYLIYMLGFTPCHPYMGGMSERIATPRLEKPRTAVPAGSVGIGGPQTVIYPIESPGGLRLIGRTPLRPFDPGARNPFLFTAGDYLRFRPITLAQYREIETQVTAGTYTPLIKKIEKTGGVQA